MSRGESGSSETVLQLRNISRVYYGNSSSTDCHVSGIQFVSPGIHTRQLLHKQLLDIYQNTNTTIVFVTHNINETVALADRVILMSPKFANIKKEFRVHLPHPRQLNHPIIDSIRRIIQGFSELYLDK
jgi:NitT/TauT family transport system ATP-binding protein